MKKTIVSILIYVLAQSPLFAQNASRVAETTYELVNGYSEVTDDGVYLIAGFFCPSTSTTGSLYLMSADSLNDKGIPGTFFPKVDSENPPTTITLDDAIYSNNLASMEYRIKKIGDVFYFTNDGKYLSNANNNALAFKDNEDDSNQWKLSTITQLAQSRITFRNNPNKGEYKIGFNKSTHNFCITKVSGNNISINLYKRVSHTIQMSTVGYSTFYYSNSAATLPEGLTAFAYRLEGSGENMKLVPSHVFNAGDRIPADCAVVLKGDEGCYSLALSAPEADEYKYDNILRGTDSAKNLTGTGDDYFYMLSLDSNNENVGFYWANDNGAAFTNNAHRAYLALPKSSGAKSIPLIFNSEDYSATGIVFAGKAIKESDVIYDLTGRRIAKPSRGLYIVNGKKYIK